MGRVRAGVVLLLLGAFLLGLAAAGRWTAMGRYESCPPRPWERFHPGLAASTPDLSSLYAAAHSRSGRPLREMAPADAMRVLYGTVADRFTHGDRATYSPYGNWVLWAIGAAVPRYRDIQDPDVLLRGGHSALCGDVSYVLMRLAGMAGIPARHVLLEGHIVMEARYDDGWHAYDPDLEVAPLDETGAVASVETLAGRPELVRRSYAGRGDPAFVETVAAIYASTGNNTCLTYPAQHIVGSPGQRPGRVEQATQYAIYIVPAILLVAGAALAGIRKAYR
jgi:hypothetical protein